VSTGQLLLYAGALLGTGLAVSLLATRLRLPGLILVLGLGMAIGSDGLQLIEFGRSDEDYELAQTVGIVALALILFEGGLAAGFDEIRPVLRPAIALAFVGTILTAVLTGIAAGAALRSLVAAGDAARIRARRDGRRRGLRDPARIDAAPEAGSHARGRSRLNDPIAVLLVVGFGEWIVHPEYGFTDMAGEFVIELTIGLATGLAVGFGAVWALRRVTLASAGLYPVTSIAIAAVAYGLGDTLHGSGFLASTSPASSSEPRARRRGGRSPRSTTACPGSRSSRCSSSSACSCFRRTSAASPSRARCWPSSRRSSPGRWR
jgi:cell volume regulation protein A